MADEEQETEDASAAPAKPSRMLAIAGLVGGLVIGGLGGSFALGPMLAKNSLRQRARKRRPPRNTAVMKVTTAKARRRAVPPST